MLTSPFIEPRPLELVLFHHVATTNTRKHIDMVSTILARIPSLRTIDLKFDGHDRARVVNKVHMGHGLPINPAALSSFATFRYLRFLSFTIFRKFLQGDLGFPIDAFPSLEDLDVEWDYHACTDVVSQILRSTLR